MVDDDQQSGLAMLCCQSNKGNDKGQGGPRSKHTLPLCGVWWTKPSAYPSHKCATKHSEHSSVPMAAILCLLQPSAQTISEEDYAQAMES
ncbi:uncharacterized [Tachysurus ichikawai]